MTTTRQANKRINQLRFQRNFFENAGASQLLFNFVSAEYAPDAEILRAIDDYRQRRIERIDSELASLEAGGSPE